MNLNQVTVPSTDVAKSIEFYKKFGLKLIVDALPYYARFECPDGDSTFSVHFVDQMKGGNRTVVYFECDDLDAKYSELKKDGIKFRDEPDNKKWLWREVRLNDSDGNPLILFNAGENRKNPPWKIN